MLFSDGKTRWTAMAQELLEACKKTAFDGTVIFTPDGVGNYDALDIFCCSVSSTISALRLERTKGPAWTYNPKDSPTWR